MENNISIRHLTNLALQNYAALTDFRSGRENSLSYKIVDYDPMFAWIRILVIDIADNFTPYNVVVDLEEYFKSDAFKECKSTQTAIAHILMEARTQAGL